MTTWRAVRTGVIALVLFALSMIRWAPLERVYGAFFRAQGELFLGIDTETHRIDFEALRPPEINDTRIRIGRTGERTALRVDCRSRLLGYQPMAVFLALLLATPMPMRRKLRALLLGGLLVSAYVLFRIELLILKGWTEHVKHCTAVHSGFLKSEAWWHALDNVTAIFVLETSVYILIPTVIWGIVAFRWPAIGRSGSARGSQ